MSSDTLGVSLVNYLCPICGNVAEEAIIMNSLLTEKNANQVKELHGKAIGYADKCCEKCAEYKDEVIYIIGIDAKKSDKEPYRTGQIVGIKRDSNFGKQVLPSCRTLGDGTTYVFIDENLGKQIGLW